MKQNMEAKRKENTFEVGNLMFWCCLQEPLNPGFRSRIPDDVIAKNLCKASCNAKLCRCGGILQIYT